MKLFLVLVFLLSSCSAEDYFSNKILYYKVTSNQSSNIDTLTVKPESSFLITKLKSSFHYKESDTVRMTVSSETNYTANDKNIQIRNPYGGYLDLALNFPNLEINLPPKMYDSIYSEFKIPKLVKLPISGKIVKGYQKVTGYDFYSGERIKDSVWVVEMQNLEDKQYKGKYYFSELYGFVYLNYQSEDLDVEIELISTEVFKDNRKIIIRKN